MGRLQFEDFELRIGRGHGESYPIWVVHSPAGEVNGTLNLPFGPGRLKDIKTLVELAMLRSRQRTRAALSSELRELKTFGGDLFDALFQDAVRAAYESSRNLALSQGKGLRLKLRIEPGELIDLPWEFLYDKAARRFLALSARTPVVRYVELETPVPPLKLSPPLHLLVVIASPSDYRPLDVEREKHRIRLALGELISKDLIQVDFLSNATVPALQDRLREGPVHMLHFIGHGGYFEERETGVLVFEDEYGEGRRVRGEQLRHLFGDVLTLRLVVLNACSGARGWDREQDPLKAYPGIAESLVQEGIAGVVANQFEVTDEAAIIFARELYSALADSFPIDAAVAEARKAIDLSLKNTVEWASPVLYSRAPDGLIFDIPEISPGISLTGAGAEANPAPELISSPISDVSNLSDPEAEKNGHANNKASVEATSTLDLEEPEERFGHRFRLATLSVLGALLFAALGFAVAGTRFFAASPPPTQANAGPSAISTTSSPTSSATDTAASLTKTSPPSETPAAASMSTDTPSATPTRTPTTTPTVTPTSVPTNTSTPTPAPSNTPTTKPTDTPTPAPTDTPTHEPTSTPVPTSTPTRAPTHTPAPSDTPTITSTPARSSLSNLPEAVLRSILSAGTDKSAENDLQTARPTATPTARPTDTPTATSTSKPTNTPTNSPTPTATSTATPTPAPTDTPTNSPTNTLTPTATSTATPTPAPTDTPTPTNSPTNSSTPTTTATTTPTPAPTDTPTPTNSPTNSPTPTATATPTPAPTDTLTPTNSPTNTSTPTTTATTTPTPTPTDTPTPTNSPTPTATATPIPAPTDTSTPTNTLTPTATSTATLTPAPTDTPTVIPTSTPTNTLTPTATSTTTPTPAPTDTPTATPTATRRPTNTPTATQNPTAMPTAAPTDSSTSTLTLTPAPTNTSTPTVTSTHTPTATSTSSPTDTPTFTSTLTETPAPTPTSTVPPTNTPTFTPTPRAVVPTNTPLTTSRPAKGSLADLFKALFRSVWGSETSTPAANDVPLASPTVTPTPTDAPTLVPRSELWGDYFSRMWKTRATATAPVPPSSAIITDEYSAYNLRSGPSSRCPVVGGIRPGMQVMAHGGWSSVNSERYPTGWEWVLIETQAGQRAWIWGRGVRAREPERGATLSGVPENDIPDCALSSPKRPAVTAVPSPEQATESTPDDSGSTPPPPTATPIPAATPTVPPSVTPTPATIRPIPRPPTPTPSQTGDH